MTQVWGLQEECPDAPRGPHGTCNHAADGAFRRHAIDQARAPIWSSRSTSGPERRHPPSRRECENGGRGSARIVAWSGSARIAASSGRLRRPRCGQSMSGSWHSRLDPKYPYRAQRSQATDAWLSAAVAFCAAAWRLLVVSLVVLLVVRTSTSAEPTAWWLFLPSVVAAAAGAWCALSHYLKDDAFRWWSPWILLVPAAPGLAYAPRPATQWCRSVEFLSASDARTPAHADVPPRPRGISASHQARTRTSDRSPSRVMDASEHALAGRIRVGRRWVAHPVSPRGHFVESLR